MCGVIWSALLFGEFFGYCGKRDHTCFKGETHSAGSGQAGGTRLCGHGGGGPPAVFGKVVVGQNPVSRELSCNDAVRGDVKSVVELSSTLLVDLSDVQCI